jgi:hypothetical protein
LRGKKIGLSKVVEGAGQLEETCVKSAGRSLEGRFGKDGGSCERSNGEITGLRDELDDDDKGGEEAASEMDD